MQPQLETANLILRPFTLADAKRVQQLAGEKIIADMTANVPHPYEDGMAEQWIGLHAQEYAEGKAIVYAVVKRQNSELVGAMSISGIANGVGELGYWIGTPFWGQGIATESAQALLQFAFSEVKLSKVIAYHLPENPASGRVMAKVGFGKIGMREKYGLELVYSELEQAAFISEKLVSA